MLEARKKPVDERSLALETAKDMTTVAEHLQLDRAEPCHEFGTSHFYFCKRKRD